jgi:hypothetical protein
VDPCGTHNSQVHLKSEYLQTRNTLKLYNTSQVNVKLTKNYDYPDSNDNGTKMKGKLLFCRAESTLCYKIPPDKDIKNIQYNINFPPKYNRETKTASPPRRVLRITCWCYLEGLVVALRKLFMAWLGRLWETKSPLIVGKSLA